MTNRLRALWVLVSGTVFAFLISQADTQTSNQSPSGGGTRGPSAIVFSRDGSTVYVAEQDEGDVAVIDANGGKVLAHIESGGTQPTGLAISSDQKTLAVTNSFSGTLGIIDLEKRSLRAKVAIPGGPWEVVIAKDGAAFVSVSQLNQVAVVDLNAAKVVDRIPVGSTIKAPSPHRIADVGVGHRPRALALTPDGSTVLCAAMNGGGLSLIDAAARKEIACIPTSAVNLRGIAVSEDGKRAYVTGQVPDVKFSTAQPESMWRNVVCRALIKDDLHLPLGAIPLDDKARGAADPGGIVILPDSDDTLIVAFGGTDSLAEVRRKLLDSGPFVLPPRVVPVGANPRALAARPGTGEIWVANHLGNSISVEQRGAAIRNIDLGVPSHIDRRLRGRILFNSARLTPARNFTCNTCHPDGNTDGLSWRLAFLKDGVERRNSRNLRGGILLTGPFGWTQRHEDFEDFVNDEIVHLLQSRKMRHADLHAFWDLINEMDMPPNPYRSPDGAMTAAALRGKALFSGQAACATCHQGSRYGASGKKEWIGTTDKRTLLDVPHLIGAYDSAPYLHDGRASTLEEVFTKFNNSRAHGKADILTSAQLSDLIEFVREL